MKSILKVTLVTFLAFFIVQTANGQRFIEKLKRKAQEKIEQRVDEKVDKELDKNLDKLENSLDSLGNDQSGDEEGGWGEAAMQNRMNAMMKGFGMSGEPVPVENSYTFNQLVQMHIETYDNETKETHNGEFITYLNASTGNLAYKVVSDDMDDNNQGLFIIDSKNKAIIMLNDKEGEKTGLVYGFGSFFEDMDDYETDEMETDEELPDMTVFNPDVKKTGKTKKIAGYECEEYTYNTEEEESEFWISKELKTSERDFFGTLFKTSALTNGMGYGYVMESNSKDKLTGDIDKMQVTRVDNNTHSTFGLSSYQITNLGTFQMPAEQEEDK